MTFLYQLPPLIGGVHSQFPLTCLVRVAILYSSRDTSQPLALVVRKPHTLHNHQEDTRYGRNRHVETFAVAYNGCILPLSDYANLIPFLHHPMSS